jgi:hypothetical protein
MLAGSSGGAVPEEIREPSEGFDEDGPKFEFASDAWPTLAYPDSMNFAVNPQQPGLVM